MWNWNTIRNKFQFCPRKALKYETFSTVVSVMQNDTKIKRHVQERRKNQIAARNGNGLNPEVTISEKNTWIHSWCQNMCNAAFGIFCFILVLRKVIIYINILLFCKYGGIKGEVKKWKKLWWIIWHSCKGFSISIFIFDYTKYFSMRCPPPT